MWPEGLGNGLEHGGQIGIGVHSRNFVEWNGTAVCKSPFWIFCSMGASLWVPLGLYLPFFLAWESEVLTEIEVQRKKRGKAAK